MEPNFSNGEFILTNKVLYNFATPYGEMSLSSSHRKIKEVDYIKRIIGLPGDTVNFKIIHFM
jgi:signal peptidase I